jgi:hypothetical protein
MGHSWQQGPLAARLRLAPVLLSANAGMPPEVPWQGKTIPPGNEGGGSTC